MKNLRDLSVVKFSQEASIRKNCFIRSESLSKISQKKFEKLAKQYNIGHIIDLRTPKEISEHPNNVPKNFHTLALPLLDEATIGISHEKGTAKAMIDNVPNLVELYRNMATSKMATQSLKSIFSFLLNKPDDKAVLIHCTEGKDRTGIISALILSILGVPEDEIMRDYLATNKANKRKSIGFFCLIFMLTFSKKRALKIKDMFIAKKEYLSAYFDEINKNFGSLKDFFKNQLNLSQHEIEKFKNLYLEK